MSLTDKNNYVRSGYIRLPNGKQILDISKKIQRRLDIKVC